MIKLMPMPSRARAPRWGRVMGFDVCGRNPSNEAGEYFRNNNWWWRPLAVYACDVAPGVAGRCKHWHTNDGDGLNNEDSITLADALQAEVDSGRCLSYRARYSPLPHCLRSYAGYAKGQACVNLFRHRSCCT